MTERIFLAGGGDKGASKLIDSYFIETVKNRHLERIVYIPIAIISRSYSECLQWFRSIFENCVPEITMWESLDSKILIGQENRLGVYIGGGNTSRLFNFIQKSKFDKQISHFITNGGVLYGGSAGAIILGKDIRTAPESINSKMYRGLNLINNSSIACHFKQEQKAQIVLLNKKIEGDIIGIEENAGVVFDGKNVLSIGPGKTYMFSDGKMEILDN